jgi:hypothetical protein
MFSPAGQYYNGRMLALSPPPADAASAAGTDPAVTDTLSALVAARNASWADLGLLLDRVDTTGAWKASARSFTDWVRGQSPALGLREASLWRYLAAVRYYRSLAESTPGSAPMPALDSVAHRVSPENLEILAKVSRVAPADVTTRLTDRVLAGTLNREALRQTWRAYRPALAGRTARGRGVRAPRVNWSDPTQYGALLAAETLTSLAQNPTDWLGDTMPDLLELFTPVEFVPAGQSAPIRFDAVVALRERRGDPLRFHGVEVRGPDTPPLKGARLDRLLGACDYLWLALHELAAPPGRQAVPEGVGLIFVGTDGVKVLRPAVRSAASGVLTGSLASELLARKLQRPAPMTAVHSSDPRPDSTA